MKMQTNTNNKSSNSLGEKVKFLFLGTLVVLVGLAGLMAVAEAQAGDIIPPDDVSNVTATPYDGSVMLTWDLALDDTETTGYNIYYGVEPVTAESGEYTEFMDAGDVLEFVVPGLENGTEYYFAITAYDASGNESESYSVEVSATPEAILGAAPEHGASDEDPPIVSSATAVNQELVSVVFSEGVVIPTTTPESAFTIINNATSEALAVTAVELDPDDLTFSTVLLTTETQVPGDEYILTVGIQVEDSAGNPIVSGTSDTAAFSGSSIAPGEGMEEDTGIDEIAPQVVSASSLSATEVQVIFSESVILNSDPTANFIITSSLDPAQTLEIMSADKDATGSVVVLTTAAQEDETYTVTVTDVIDESANFIDEATNTAEFVGTPEGGEPTPEEEPPVEEEEEVVPEPEEEVGPISQEVKNLVVKIIRDLVVRLTWEKSESPDVTDQILYKSLDGGSSYDAGTSLGPDREEVEITGLKAGKEYYFKVTTKNAAGEESNGVITSIRLPETGMGIGLLFGASAGLAYINNRRKRNKQ